MRAIQIFCLTAAATLVLAFGRGGERTALAEPAAAEKIVISVGDRQFTAALLDNAAADELRARVPLTLDMSELNGNEKYFYLPESLPGDSRQVDQIQAGDLMLYGSDCLVLFYDSFSTSYRYTRLGHVEDAAGLAQALGKGDVQVGFAAEGDVAVAQGTP